MMTEIILNCLSETGEFFKFSSSEISKISVFKNILVPDENNSIGIKVTPIGDTHFEVEVSINLRRSINCSKCGEVFQNWFTNCVKEYLSLEVDEVGEDQGFLLVDSPKWFWPDFVVESIELETPYQIYKYGEKCLESCPYYDEAVKKGWITKGEIKPNPFQALKKLKNKLN